MKISSLDLKMFRLLEDLIALGMILNNAGPLEVKEWNLTVETYLHLWLYLGLLHFRPCLLVS